MKKWIVVLAVIGAVVAWMLYPTFLSPERQIERTVRNLTGLLTFESGEVVSRLAAVHSLPTYFTETAEVRITTFGRTVLLGGRSEIGSSVAEAVTNLSWLDLKIEAMRTTIISESEAKVRVVFALRTSEELTLQAVDLQLLLKKDGSDWLIEQAETSGPDWSMPG